MGKEEYPCEGGCGAILGSPHARGAHYRSHPQCAADSKKARKAHDGDAFGRRGKPSKPSSTSTADHGREDLKEIAERLRSRASALREDAEKSVALAEKLESMAETLEA